MQEIQFMIKYENRRITTPNFFLKRWLLLKYFLKFRIVLFYISDRFGKTALNVIVIFIFKDSSLRYITIFQYFLMYIFFLH